VIILTWRLRNYHRHVVIFPRTGPYDVEEVRNAAQKKNLTTMGMFTEKQVKMPADRSPVYAIAGLKIHRLEFH
jgi:hypothetical protein